MRCHRSVSPGLAWLAVLVAGLGLLVAACGGGASGEELAGVQRELEAARAQAQTLKTQVDETREQVARALLADLGVALNIYDMLVYEPTVVEIKPVSAALVTVTKEDTICTVTYGLTTDYGHISTDMQMAPRGHKNHYHLIQDLKPDTSYHYRWALVAPNGTVYGSKDHTFRTLPAGAGASQP